MRRLALAVSALLLTQGAARAEDLWAISASAELIYLIDAESVILLPGDVAKATVHHIYFDPRPMEDGTLVRLVTREMDFDCQETTYLQTSGVGIADSMIPVVEIPSDGVQPIPPSSNIEGAATFACADEEQWPQIAERIQAPATLDHAVELARQVGAQTN